MSCRAGCPGSLAFWARESTTLYPPAQWVAIIVLTAVALRRSGCGYFLGSCHDRASIREPIDRERTTQGAIGGVPANGSRGTRARERQRGFSVTPFCDRTQISRKR
jgi:hypothetical protein